MTINPHITKLVGIERNADLRRAAAPRPEATAKRPAARRIRRAHRSPRAIRVAGAEDR